MPILEVIEEEFTDAFQDEASSIMGKNLDQAFCTQDDLVWNEMEGSNQWKTEEKKEESTNNMTLQPPQPNEPSPVNKKMNAHKTWSGCNICKPSHYHQILMAVTANIIGALLIPELPATTSLIMTKPIVHPVKDMQGATTGVAKCSILDEPELKPGQGISQPHLDYIQMHDSIYDGLNDDDADQLSTLVLMLDDCVIKKAKGVCVPLAKVNWLCKDMPTWI
jgi:hypothetical protein